MNITLNKTYLKSRRLTESIVDEKVTLILLGVNKDADYFKEYTMSVTKIAELLNMNESEISEYYNNVSNIESLRNSIVILKLDEDNAVFVELFSKIEYNRTAKNFKFKFNHDFCKKFLNGNESNFVNIGLENIYNIPDLFTLRLYLLFATEPLVNGKATVQYDEDELMFITGYHDDEY